MSGRPLYARLGLEIRPTGSAGSLAATIGGMEVDAANRLGFYSELSAGTERLGVVVGGSEVARLWNDPTQVWLEVLGYQVVANHLRVGDVPGGYSAQDGDIWYDGTEFNFRADGITITGTPVANGTVDNALLRWDDGSSNWVEEPDALLTADGHMTLSDGLTVGGDTDLSGNLDVAGNTVSFGAAGDDLDLQLRSGSSTHIRILAVDDGDATDPDDLLISHYTGAAYVDYLRIDVSAEQVRSLQQFVTTGVAHPVSVRTSAHAMTNDDHTILADVAAGAFAVTLPASPTNGQVAVVKKYDDSTNAVTITGTVDGVVNPTLTAQYQFKVMQWVAADSQWVEIG